MPRRLLTILLVTLLTRLEGNSWPTQPDQRDSVKAQVQALGVDTLVEVRLQNGDKFRGWIGPISESAVQIRLGKAKLENRAVAFNEVRSIRTVKSVKPSHTLRNILIGAGIAVTAIAVGIVIAAKRTGYL